MYHSILQCTTTTPYRYGPFDANVACYKFAKMHFLIILAAEKAHRFKLQHLHQMKDFNFNKYLKKICNKGSYDHKYVGELTKSKNE